MQLVVKKLSAFQALLGAETLLPERLQHFRFAYTEKAQARN